MRWDYAPLDINSVFPGLGEIIFIIAIIIVIIIIIIIHHNSVNLYSCFCFKRAA